MVFKEHELRLVEFVKQIRNETRWNLPIKERNRGQQEATSGNNHNHVEDKGAGFEISIKIIVHSVKCNPFINPLSRIRHDDF